MLISKAYYCISNVCNEFFVKHGAAVHGHIFDVNANSMPQHGFQHTSAAQFLVLLAA